MKLASIFGEVQKIGKNNFRCKPCSMKLNSLTHFSKNYFLFSTRLRNSKRTVPRFFALYSIVEKPQILSKRSFYVNTNYICQVRGYCSLHSENDTTSQRNPTPEHTKSAVCHLYRISFITGSPLTEHSGTAFKFDGLGLLSFHIINPSVFTENDSPKVFEIRSRKNQVMNAQLRYDSEITLNAKQIELVMRWTSFFLVDVLRIDIDWNKITNIYIVPFVDNVSAVSSSHHISKIDFEKIQQTMRQENMLLAMTALLERYKKNYPTIEFSWELLRKVEQLNIYESMERENLFVRPSENSQNHEDVHRISVSEKVLLYPKEAITRKLGEELRRSIPTHIKEVVTQLILEMRKMFVGRVFYCLYTQKFYFLSDIEFLRTLNSAFLLHSNGDNKCPESYLEHHLFHTASEAYYPTLFDLPLLLPQESKHTLFDVYLKSILFRRYTELDIHQRRQLLEKSFTDHISWNQYKEKALSIDETLLKKRPYLLSPEFCQVYHEDLNIEMCFFGSFVGDFLQQLTFYENIGTFEAKTRIIFKNKQLLRYIFTHPSFAPNEMIVRETYKLSMLGAALSSAAFMMEAFLTLTHLTARKMFCRRREILDSWKVGVKDFVKRTNMLSYMMVSPKYIKEKDSHFTAEVMTFKYLGGLIYEIGIDNTVRFCLGLLSQPLPRRPQLFDNISCAKVDNEFAKQLVQVESEFGLKLPRDLLVHICSMRREPRFQSLELVGDSFMRYAVASWLWKLTQCPTPYLIERLCLYNGNRFMASVMSDVFKPGKVKATKSKADIFERIVGTICIECGWAVAEQFLHRIFARYSHEFEHLITSAPQPEVQASESLWSEESLLDQFNPFKKNE
jgi:dsRNA-specific ribonuclease